MAETLLAIELENGKFAGLSSNAPEEFEDVTVLVMDRQVSAAEASADPLAAFDMVPVQVDPIGDDETTEPVTFSVARIPVSPSAWALAAMVEGMAGGVVAEEDDALVEGDDGVDLAAE